MWWSSPGEGDKLIAQSSPEAPPNRLVLLLVTSCTNSTWLPFFPPSIIHTAVRVASQPKEHLYCKRSETRNSSTSYTTRAGLSEKKKKWTHTNQLVGELSSWGRCSPVHCILYAWYLLTDAEKAMHLTVTSVLLRYLCYIHGSEKGNKVFPPRRILCCFVRICLPTLHVRN